MKLSVCMIVKNEMEYIGYALESVRPIASELIIVDTGSTDGTAEKYATHHFEWRDDFAAARNFSLEQATGDWALIIDADEILDHEHCKYVTQLAQGKPAAYQVTQRHYHNTGDFIGSKLNTGTPYDRGVYHVQTRIERLFPLKHGIEFVYRVHEQITPSCKANGIPIKLSPIVMHHYGYLKENGESDKREMYARIGRLKVEDEPDNAKARFELGVLLYSLEQYSEAAQHLRRYVQLSPNRHEGFMAAGLALFQSGAKSEGLLFMRRAYEIAGLPEYLHNIRKAEKCV